MNSSNRGLGPPFSCVATPGTERPATMQAAVRAFGEQLRVLELRSRGFVSLRAYLERYTDSDVFEALVRETQQVEDKLAAVTYAVLIKATASG